jgi:hypothetical protein
MDWIFDNFQIVALVGLALASWLKSRMDAKAAEQEERRAREEMEEGGEIFGPPESWEEEDRGSFPVPPIPVFPPPLPHLEPPVLPATGRSAEAAQREQTALQHQLDLQERFRQLREAKAVTTGGAAVTRARSDARRNPQAATQPASFKKLLKDRSSIRRAVVLREILGPPISMRKGPEI